MKVSAICPTYNRSYYLPSAITCFLSQTYINSELIIVDDGTDNASRCIPSHPRIKYIKLEGPRKRLGEKRNICCSLASGDIIISWDDDDLFANNRIETQISQLDRLNKQLLGYYNVIYWDEMRKLAYRYNSENNKPYWAHVPCTTYCFRKSWWETHQFENRLVLEDIPFAKQAEEAGQMETVDGNKVILIRSHWSNTYKMPLDRLTKVDRNEIPYELQAHLRGI